MSADEAPAKDDKGVVTAGQPSAWNIRDAAWAVCLELGLFALLCNITYLFTGLVDTVRGLPWNTHAGVSTSPVPLAATARAISGLAVAWLATRLFRVSWSAFGIKRPSSGILWPIGFTAAIAFAYVGGGALLLYQAPDFVESLTPRSAISTMGFWWVLTGFCIAAPIGEEVIYRGILYKPLRNRLGVWKAIVISAAVFAVMHNLLSFTLFLPWTQFAGGLIFAYAYEKTDSLLYPVLYHACGNALLFVAYALLLGT